MDYVSAYDINGLHNSMSFITGYYSIFPRLTENTISIQSTTCTLEKRKCGTGKFPFPNAL